MNDSDWSLKLCFFCNMFLSLGSLKSGIGKSSPLKPGLNLLNDALYVRLNGILNGGLY